jgi:serine protease Do
VRIVNFKGVDMNLFKFDYDLTFAVLMMNADGRTYSRFGTQDHRSSANLMSIAGLKKTMRDVLALHKSGPGGGTPPASTARVTLQDMPAFRNSKQAKEECYHCHFANNARFKQLRLEGKFTKEVLFQYPHPENIGVALDVDVNNRVQSVLPGSAAEKAGLKAGDRIVRADTSPVFNAADLQFALNPLPDPGAVTLHLERNGARLQPVKLQLPKGWRRTDISWRPSQDAIPPQIGIWGRHLNASEKQQRGIPADKLGIQVNFFFPGTAWAKTRGDLRNGDILVGLNGEMLPEMTMRQFHAHYRLKFNVGDTATLNVLRGGQRMEIQVPCVAVEEP